MAGIAGQLSVLIKGSTGGLTQSLRDAENKVDAFHKNVSKKQATLKPLSPEVNSGIAGSLSNSLASSLAGIFGPGGMLVGMIGGTLAAAFGGQQLVRLVGQSIQLASEIEDASVSFGVLFQSADKAKEVVKDLRNLAKETPLTSKDLIDTGVLLAGSGVDASQIQPTLRVLGDVAAAGGKPLKEIVLLYNQIRAKGKLYAEEAGQFADKGIIINELLAKSLGKTVPEITAMTTAGLISFPMLQKALADVTSQGGQLFGMMEARSKTLSGMFSTLKDNWETLLGNVGQAIIDEFELKPLMGRFSQLFSEAADGADTIRPVLQAMKNLAAEIGQALLEGIISAVQVAGDLVSALREAAGDFKSIKGVGQKAGSEFFGNPLFGLLGGPMKKALGIAITEADPNLKKAINDPALAKDAIEKPKTIFDERSESLRRSLDRMRDILTGAANDVPDMADVVKFKAAMTTLPGTLGVFGKPLTDIVAPAIKVAETFGMMEGPMRKFIIEQEKLNADQIKRATGLKEQFDPRIKLNRELNELRQIRDRGGFKDNPAAFGLGVQQIFEPLIKDISAGQQQMAAAMERGSAEARSVINSRFAEQTDPAERAVQLLEEALKAHKAQVEASVRIGNLLEKTDLLEVK